MAASDTYGLVICGGSSSRMGCDKCQVIYHQKEQSYHVYDMLAPFFSKVLLCCNNLQATNIQPPYLYLTDHDFYKNSGPMGALLTAYKTHPGKNFVALGCDYPFLTPATLSIFINSIADSTTPAAFYNNAVDLYEPLLAFYTAANMEQIKKIFGDGNYSLQYFLRQQKADKFTQYQPGEIKSVDTLEEMEAARKQLKQKND